MTKPEKPLVLIINNQFVPVVEGTSKCEMQPDNNYTITAKVVGTPLITQLSAWGVSPQPKKVLFSSSSVWGLLPQAQVTVTLVNESLCAELKITGFLGKPTFLDRSLVSRTRDKYYPSGFSKFLSGASKTTTGIRKGGNAMMKQGLLMGVAIIVIVILLTFIF